MPSQELATRTTAKDQDFKPLRLRHALPPCADPEQGSISLMKPRAEKRTAEYASALVLLGSYGSASSAIVSPSPINYLAVRLRAGERWRYEPPMGHTVL
jgi:hypothetical protein